MAQFLDLPPELFIIIFFLLDNIDDALHLARTCRFVNAIFEAPRRRLSIFTRVIQNGDHHKYDLQLHASEKYCADFRKKHYKNQQRLEDAERPFFPAEFFDRGFGSLYTKLGPDTVWSIVYRWHAMKALFQLYCDSNIRPSYLRSIFWQAAPEDQTIRWQAAAEYEISLPTPSGKECKTLRSMAIADKMAAYARFYRSVCSHWLCVNITWAAGISQHADSKACKNTFGMIKVLWCDDLERSLQEKIEAIEVTDFVWGFLARKVFDLGERYDEFSEWFNGGQIYEPVLFERHTMSRYTRLMRLATFYISPPHIIELLHDKWRLDEGEEDGWDSDHEVYCPVYRRLDKKPYLRKLGLWDEKFGVFEGADGRIPTLHFSTDLLNLIEWWGVNRIVDGEMETEAEFAGDRNFMNATTCKWVEYRLSRWIDDLRGRPILYPEADQQLIQRIKEC